MVEEITVVETSAWHILLEISDSVSRCEESLFSQVGVTNQQFHVLLTLVFLSGINNSPITITDLAPQLNRSTNSISSIVDRMEKNGIVEKSWDLPDRRSARLTVTSKGENILKKTIGPHAELIKRLLSTFSDEELQILVSLMKKLRSRVNEELHLSDVEISTDGVDPENLTWFLNRLKV